MPSEPDPRKILGVDADASPSEIKQAYYRVAAKYHPDAGGDAWVFQQVQNAFNELSGDRQNPESASAKSRPADSRSGKRQQTNQRGSRDYSAADPTYTDNATDNAAGNADWPPHYYTQQSYGGQNEPQSPKSDYSEAASGGIRHLLTGNLPLQSETSFFILVSVLDIFMTYIVLRFGGIEANPIARFFFDRWNIQGMIAFKMVMVTIVVVLAQVVAIRNANRARMILIGGSVVVGCVLAYSASLMASLR